MKKLFVVLFALVSFSFAQTTQVNHGGTGLNSTADNDVLIGTGPNTYTLVTLPDCQDIGGNHFNYTASTHTVTCGLTASGGGCSTTGAAGHCAYYLNDGTTGTSLYHTVRFADATTNQQHVRDFLNTDPGGWGSGFLGICQSGCGTSGLAEICYAGRCKIDLQNAGTEGDFIDLGIPTSNAPKGVANSAAGVNENPEVHTFFGKVHTTIASAGVTDVDLLPVGAYSTVQTTAFGTGYLGIVFAGSPFITSSPFALSLTNNGGQTFPADSTNPALSITSAFRAHSISNQNEWFDIYGRQLPGHSDSDLVIDDVASMGFNGGSLRIACDQAGGCISSLYHAWSHYSPAYGGTSGASVSGNITITDTQADSWNLKLTGNTTITSFNNVNAGHISNWNICQDATGSRTFTASALIGMPTIVSTASTCTTFSAFGIDNTHLYVFNTGAGGGGSGTVTSITAGTGLTGGTITTSGTIALSTPVAVADGGTGVTSAQGNGTKVQLSTGTTTTDDCVKYDANGNTVDAGAPCGSGSSGISGATANGAVYATAATTATSTGALTDGQILVGDSSGAPAATTITAGSNITVTNGHHSITIASTGGGSSTAGPGYAAAYCTSNTFSCASRFNVVANQLIIATCQYWTNGTGNGTPTFSDTLGLTWTQIDTGMNSSRGIATWWANPGATTGSDTFTCSNSNSTVLANMSFGGMTVNLITGATLASPIDAHVTQNGSNVIYNQAITTTADNDLIFMVAEYGGGWTAFTNTYLTAIPAHWTAIWNDTGGADVVLSRTTNVAGTYYLQGTFSAAHAFSLFAIK